MNFRHSGEKTVHVPGYDGPDRRGVIPARRSEDVIAANLKLVATIVSFIIIILTVGIAWGTAKATLDSKVNREEFVEKNADQDKQRSILESRQDRFEGIMLQDVIPTLKRLDDRVSAIYCADKPPGCK
jgi:hypothetical protein